ncbi:MAG: hypothetical protein K2X46_11630 [Roseomonas sp.]|nr:hypothetical protein [Roseomonas sp.]
MQTIFQRSTLLVGFQIERHAMAKARSLRDAGIKLGQDLQKLVDDLDRRSPREAAIVAHGLIEASLRDVARSSCVQNSVDKSIFLPSGILGSYYSLYTVTHAFGIIPTALRDDLKRIGKIRNAFAHSIEHLDFDSDWEGIRENCNRLKLPEQYREIGKDMGAETEDSDYDSREGILLTDPLGFIGGQALFEKEAIHSTKSRFLASTKVAWIILTAKAIHLAEEQQAKSLS